MIKLRFYRNYKGDLYGFECENHGEPVVCAAVSALTLNCANTLEELAGLRLECLLDENKGYLRVLVSVVKDGGKSEKAELLLGSLALGIKAIADEYPGEIEYDFIKKFVI